MARKKRIVEIDPSIGQRMKEWRKRKVHITQKKLAEMFDVSEITIRNWENGRIAVPDYAKNKFCQTYDVSREWLESGNPVFINDGYRPIGSYNFTEMDSHYDTEGLSCNVRLIEYIEKELHCYISEMSSICGDDQVQNFMDEIDAFISFRYNYIMKKEGENND